MPARETRTDYLNRIFASLANIAPDDDELSIVFIPFRGWMISSMGGRFFGDDGFDFIGENWQEAEIQKGGSTHMDDGKPLVHWCEVDEYVHVFGAPNCDVYCVKLNHFMQWETYLNGQRFGYTFGGYIDIADRLKEAQEQCEKHSRGEPID